MVTLCAGGAAAAAETPPPALQTLRVTPRLLPQLVLQL